MSIMKLQIILLSSVLTLSTAPLAFPQTTQKEGGATSAKMQKEMAPSQDEIKKAQQALKDKGMYTGAVDGTMNAQFEKSLRDYQEANKLKATGKLDHATMMRLGLPPEHHEGKGTEMKKEGTPTKPSTGEKSGTTTGTETKKKGGKQSRYHSSEKVKEVQTALQEKGFNPGPIDGIMGPKTTKALASFQRQQNLYANGKLDERTERELGIGTGKGTEVPGEREKPAPMPPAPKPDQSKPQAPPPDQSQVVPPVQSGADRMGIGMASAVEDIRAAQMALKNRGYDPGEINGMVSSQTQQALRHFQAANNLPVTGVFDIRTQAALGVVVRGTTNPDVPSPDLSYNNNVGGPSAIEPERAKPAEADVSDRLANATEVIQDLTKAGDRKIPDELLARADAIAIIPHVVKPRSASAAGMARALLSSGWPTVDGAHRRSSLSEAAASERRSASAQRIWFWYSPIGTRSIRSRREQV
jgi:peptidoglycan hydrolase-like protein with peptidoglycan-binding domain